MIALFTRIDTVAVSVAMAVAAVALTTAAALFILVYLFSVLAGEIYDFGVPFGTTQNRNNALPMSGVDPDLSVIVIPLIGRDVLTHCLDRLPLGSVECIVVLRKAMGATTSWERRYPLVTFLSAADELVPVRRQCGIGAATGDIVALIEDTSWPDEGWCAAARSAFLEAQTAAAGGAVRIAATLPSRYQALGWCEYGAFAPKPATQTDRLVRAYRVPGNNMAFRRVELIEVMRGEHNGLLEGHVCDRLLDNGRRVVYQPRMSVTYAACDRHNAALATRLHHGRIYAAAQVRGRPWPWRLAHVAKAPFLPLVLTLRRMVSMAGSSRLPARLWVLFWIALMESAWALGEAIGGLAGEGKSMNEWR